MQWRNVKSSLAILRQICCFSRTPGYTTYVRPKEIERFFADCPDDVDAVKIAGWVLSFLINIRDKHDFSEIRKSLETTVTVARRYYRRIEPTAYEFLALLGLALWNDGIWSISKKQYQWTIQKFRTSTKRCWKWRWQIVHWLCESCMHTMLTKE